MSHTLLFGGGFLVLSSQHVSVLFQEQVHGWNCDMFQLEALTDVQPLRYTGYHLFKHHQLLEEYKVFMTVWELSNTIPTACCLQISKSSLDAFLCRVEEAYQTHSNPYHNSTHAADVLQTVHCLVVTTNLSVSNTIMVPSVTLCCCCVYRNGWAD